ncbi:hypothetical protein ARGLB_047_00670 [Arthrobacter globiformis NBRC 12137]|uniref:Uncharacterized protein n=3 Tax=Arthrobacter TaxID=1663 RepID=H0QLL6_ARTG1|nr:hypothetical protein ARGLB_047_00670 [Arthrobacter globiformis NBRC 12137]
MISPMRHMGNSGKTAIGAFAAAAGLLVLTAVTLEEAALVAFLGALAVGYVASVAEAFARHRYLALLAGGAGTSLFIGCSIAFLRMWGLAFNQSPAALGQAVTTRDSDIYFYLAAASGCLTLLVLFCAAVWPSRRRLRRESPTRPAAAARPRGVSPARAAGAPSRPATRLPAGARQPAQAPVRQQQAQRPAQPKPPQQKRAVRQR